MSFGAPDPDSFVDMENAFAIASPAAAIAIVLPAFTFGPSCTQIARLIYMNQANPGSIMKVGAYWMQLAEQYIEAGDQLDEEISAMDAESWEGDDCNAFVEQAGKVRNQLFTIAAFALQVGISLFTIAALLAVMVTAYAALAAALMAMATVYWPLQAFPPTAAAAQSVRTAAMTVAATGLTVLKALDTALEVLGKGLAAFITGGMISSWGLLATQGNAVNPLELVGPTAFNMAQGFAQLGLRNAMAPSGGRHVAGGLGHVALGGQGVYNTTLNANDIAADGELDGEEDPRGEYGVDPGNLDFIPAIDAPEIADDDLPDWGGTN